MSTVASVPRSFMDSLSWVRCLFCLKQFSRDQQFFIFACNAIACFDCAKRIHSRKRTAPNKIECLHCNKVVSFCAIRDEMPQHIRKMFESPMKLGEDIIRIHGYQQRVRGLVHDNVRSKYDKLKQLYNERCHQIQQLDIATQEIRADPRRNQILKVLPEERLQQLLQLNEEQLESMTFDEMKMSFPKPKRRNSRQFSMGPNDPANTSSTPTSFDPHGSRSSSSRPSDSERHLNFNRVVVDLASPNVVSQRRRSRCLSRDNPQNMHPVFEAQGQHQPRHQRTSHDVHQPHYSPQRIHHQRFINQIL